MTYINREEFKRKLIDEKSFFPVIVARALEEMPAAEVEEVKYGEWIDNHCSVCRMTPLGEELWEHLNITPPKFELCMDYCPCCGAKMDGKGDMHPSVPDDYSFEVGM